MIFAGADATGFEEDARLTAMWLWTLSTGRRAGDGVTRSQKTTDDEEGGEEGQEGRWLCVGIRRGAQDRAGTRRALGGFDAHHRGDGRKGPVVAGGRTHPVSVRQGRSRRPEDGARNATIR